MLFSPIRIGSVTIPNRIVKSAMAEGKPVEIRIRQDDELHDLINLLNEYLAGRKKE